MSQWYYGENGQQTGPLDDAGIRAAIHEGRVKSDTLVWREGFANWRPLSEIDEFSQPLPSASEPVYHALNTGVTIGRTPSSAIASLVCGIIGLVPCLVVVSIPAVICGHVALKEIYQSPVPMAGRGMALSGLIMGYLGLLFFLVIVGLFIKGIVNIP